jgi:hypothetical protein
MCVPGMQTFPEKPTPFFGLTLQSGAPRQAPSSIPPSSASSAMPAYSDAQQPMGQQQVQPASMPRATTGRFSFNNGNFRMGDSTMSGSDTGLNI